MWNGTTAQLPFFIDYLKQDGLFDGFVADCPLHYGKRLVTAAGWRA
jgi:hypothetical protein